MRGLPADLRRSLTWDQGAELTEHALLRLDSGFAGLLLRSPQSMAARDEREYQRPAAAVLSEGLGSERPSRELAAVALALNTRPRKTLGWRTPAEALNDLLRAAHAHPVATTD
jgi:hypothetical protein